MDQKLVRMRIENSDHEIIEEKLVVLNPGDTLIVRTPEKTTIPEMKNLSDFLQKVIEGEHKVAIMPNTIDLMILKKEV